MCESPSGQQWQRMEVGMTARYIKTARPRKRKAKPVSVSDACMHIRLDEEKVRSQTGEVYRRKGYQTLAKAREQMIVR
jgi:hypothetical protein